MRIYIHYHTLSSEAAMVSLKQNQKVIEIKFFVENTSMTAIRFLLSDFRVIQNINTVYLKQK